MNEPIINPWIFYIAEILDNISCILTGALFVLVIAIMLLGLNYSEKGSYYDEDDRRVISARKHFKISVITLCVVSLINIFVPTSKTVFRMIIAQHVTPVNIQMVGEGTEKAVEKVIEKILNYQIKLEKKDGR